MSICLCLKVQTCEYLIQATVSEHFKIPNLCLLFILEGAETFTRSSTETDFLNGECVLKTSGQAQVQSSVLKLYWPGYTAGLAWGVFEAPLYDIEKVVFELGSKISQIK